MIHVKVLTPRQDIKGERERERVLFVCVCVVSRGVSVLLRMCSLAMGGGVM